MKDKILQLIAAFVALLHTKSDDKEAVAQLKGQIADLQSQLKSSVQFTPDDIVQINAAANMMAAAEPAPAPAVAAAAAIAPATPTTDAPTTPTAAAPADVATAASATPASS